jgi:drug/metabolite transporter (DMT)-like permease
VNVLAMEADPRSRGIFFLLLAIFATGCFPLPYAKAMQSITPVVAVVGIFCWAMLFSIPGAWHLRRKVNFRLKNIVIIIAVAFLGVMANYSICQAIAGSSATMFNVISRAEIIIAMILGWVFLHEPVGLRVWMAIAVVLSGILLMRVDTLTVNLEDWETVLWALSTAGCFASIQVLTKAIIHEIDPQVLNVLRLSLAVGMMLALPGLAVEVSALNLEGWGWLGLAAFFGPFLGRVAYTYSLRYHTIAKAMTAITFSPILTLILEFLIFGRMLSVLELMGGALVITGILIAFREGSSH